MSARWRCTYEEGMNAAEPQDWRFDSHWAREIGQPACTCVHEAGHTVVRYALGFHAGPTVVQTRFEKEHDLLWATTCGVSCPQRDKPLPDDIGEIGTGDKIEIVRELGDDDPLMCWRPFFASAIITCGGHAAERKFRILSVLPVSARSAGDRYLCENYARDFWNASGCDGDAFLRMAWRMTQKFLDIPQIWRAVCAVEAALFSGYIWRESDDPRAGDITQFVLPGEEAERLMEALGCRFGMLREEHSCKDGACLRRRPISRRWQEKVAKGLENADLSNSQHSACDLAVA